MSVILQSRQVFSAQYSPDFPALLEKFLIFGAKTSPDRRNQVLDTMVFDLFRYLKEYLEGIVEY